MKCKVIATGSTGNAVIYGGNILVDCGVSFKSIKPYLKQIDIVLLTHKHGDHINISTLKKMQLERPSLRIGCCEWMMKHLKGLYNIDMYELNQVYNYSNTFSISPVKLYHDVPNCGYRLNIEGYKVFHATDTCTLNGIVAKGYDLYAIEHNYDEDKVDSIIEESINNGQYSHIKGSTNSHLSLQQAISFIHENKKESSEVVRLHESSRHL